MAPRKYIIRPSRFFDMASVVAVFAPFLSAFCPQPDLLRRPAARSSEKPNQSRPGG